MRTLPIEAVSEIRNSEPTREGRKAAVAAWLETDAGKQWREQLGNQMPRGDFDNLVKEVIGYQQPIGRLVKAKTGSWGRETHSGGRVIVAALTAAECAAEGLTPGPANF